MTRREKRIKGIWEKEGFWHRDDAIYCFLSEDFDKMKRVLSRV